jgi:EpsI family protein
MPVATAGPSEPVLDRPQIRAGVLALAFAVLYTGVVGQLVATWSNNYLYSYGFAVPFISAYMVWTKWPELKWMDWAPNYALGLPIVAVGVAMLVAGGIGAVDAVQQLSFIVTLTGLTLVVFGTAIFRAAWFPILYLLLMLPLWDQPISRLQIPSQLLSARIAVGMLDAVNVPVAREATYILLPGQTLEVLRECSGVNQLIVVFAMALPAAYLFLSGFWRRVTLVAIALLIAYLCNGFRIALLGILAQHGYQEATRGTLHLLQGLAVSGTGYLLIGAVLSWLARGTSVAQQRPADFAGRRTVRRPWIEASVLVLLVASATYLLTFKAAPVALSKELGALPRQLGDWVMDPAAGPTSVDLRLPVMDDQMVRDYRNATGERVRLYVGYYRHQEAGKELSAATVGELQAGAERLALTEEGDVNGYIRTRGTDTSGVLYWFDVNGRIVDQIYAAKAYTILDALTRRRTNAALVVVQWESRRPGDPGAHDRARDFVRLVLHALRQSLPL